MAEKVVLPKEVAEAIEHLRNIGYEDEFILETTADAQDEWVSKESRPLNGFNTLKLASALVNGYEVEQSPEDKLREYYGMLSEAHNPELRRLDDYGHTMVGVKETLKFLGITIDGINA